MTRVAKVSVDLEANSSRFESGLARADRAMQASGNRWSRIGNEMKSGFASLGKTLGIVTAAGAGVVTGLAVAIKKAIETGDEIAKAADRVGLATGAFQELRYAAGQSGVAAEEFSTSLEYLNRQIGTGKTRYADLSSALDGIADRMAAARSGAERAAIANEFFGRSGAKMIPFLKDGAAGVNRLRAEARDLGIVLEESLLRQAEKAGDELDRMEKIVGANLTRALLSLTPTVIALGEAAARYAPALAAFVGSLLSNELAPLAELQRRLGEVNEKIAAAQKLATTTAPLGRQAIRDRVAGLQEESAAIEALIASREAEAAARDKLFENETATSEKSLDLIRRRTEALRLELQTFGMSAAEKEKARLTEAALNQARADGVEITAALRAELAGEADAAAALVAELEFLKEVEAEVAEAHRIAAQNAAEMARAQAALVDEGRRLTEAVDPAARYANTMERLNKLLEAGAISQHVFTLAAKEAAEELDRASQKTQEVSDWARDMGMTFESAFEKAVLGGESLRDVLAGILKDIAAVTLRQTVTGPLGSALSSGIGSIFGGIFGGARAEGGPVMSGKAYLIGERGPELFAPSMSGTIIPNDAIGSGGGGTVIINAQGVDGAQVTRLERIVARHIGDHREIVVNTVGTERSRGAGGAFGGAFGRT